MQAMAGHQSLTQGAHNNYVEDSSRQNSSSLSRKLSRGSTNHRASNSMRVVKPNSASNSPQGQWHSARRRTMMQDTATSRRTQQVLEQLLTSEELCQSQQMNRSSRPVSWHPGSYMQQQPFQGSYLSQPLQSSFPAQPDYAERQQSPTHYPHMSPGMVACSAGTSPASVFSPLPLQYTGPAAHNSHNTWPDTWQAVQKSTPFYPTPNEPRDVTEAFPSFGNDVLTSAHPANEGSDWHHYIMHGMHTTTPPTPDSTVPEPALPAIPQESPAFQCLDEPEEDGEVLVGMGLYDAPEKVNDDPQLDNYRSTVSSLLGSRFRPTEPQGKGLKLEETWSPPPKSEEDEEDEEDVDEEEA
ncbi:hypothetical protein LIA77_01134 [Sarocladium implicatum]|nr:hypothetical protein LIA77_01134 [Sarocladium implicatum]